MSSTAVAVEMGAPPRIGSSATVDAAKVRRIQYFWMTTGFAVESIAAQVLLTKRQVETIIAEHPEWERSMERTRTTYEDGMRRVMDVIIRCVRKREVFPDDRQLGYELNHDHTMIQSYVRNLVRDGVITSQRIRVNGNAMMTGEKQVTWYRLIRIVATGEKTATPQEAKKPPSEFNQMVEAAKNYLRRSGPTVFDAKVLHPSMQEGNSIYVDYKLYSLNDFLKLAVEKGFNFGATKARSIPHPAKAGASRSKGITRDLAARAQPKAQLHKHRKTSGGPGPRIVRRARESSVPA